MCDRHSGEEGVDRDTSVTTDVGQDLIGVVDGADLCAAKFHSTVWETAVYQQDERGAVGHHSSVNFL